MANKVQLLVIDGQFDFCDPSGALFVPGANEDMKRMTAMITKGRDKLNNIQATLDSHRNLHIAHPIWWQDKNGKNPDPFAIITVDDVESGKWRAANPGFQQRSLDYVRTLQKNGRYVLCIWPPHCLIGGDGHKVYPELFAAFSDWEKSRFSTVDYTTKGSNIFTEHYSAVQADVPDPKDLTTGLNVPFIESFRDYDMTYIGGEALNFCVANTMNDVAKEFGDDQLNKFGILEDCCSMVPGFEKLGEDFVSDMKARGMQFVKSTDALG